jgi:sugar phosphate isomerase/epimerase
MPAASLRHSPARAESALQKTGSGLFSSVFRGRDTEAIESYKTGMNLKSSRRDFIKSASVLPAGLAVGTAGFSAMAAEPAAKTEGHPLKISLNAFCFSQSLTAPAGGKPAMTYFDVLEFCAKNNFDAIDPTGYYFPGYPKVPEDSYINEFKRRAFKLGLDISGTGVRNSFAQSDQVKRAADVQLVKDWIEVAAKLGAPVIRVFAGAEESGHSRDEVNKWMVENLKECVEHGKKHGVLVGIQNHGDYLKNAEQVIEIVKMVDSEWFGVIVDTGNFQQADHGDPYQQIAKVLPYAVNFQVKESPYGRESKVRMDVKKLVQVVRAGGYRGYLPIETLVATPADYNPTVTVPKFLKEVREALES